MEAVPPNASLMLPLRRRFAVSTSADDAPARGGYDTRGGLASLPAALRKAAVGIWSKRQTEPLFARQSRVTCTRGSRPAFHLPSIARSIWAESCSSSPSLAWRA
jgi:hypothetical protein